MGSVPIRVAEMREPIRVLEVPDPVQDQAALQLLNQHVERHANDELIVGCSKVAHRKLRFCAWCVAARAEKLPLADQPKSCSAYGASTEISGWRLLEMAYGGPA